MPIAIRTFIGAIGKHVADIVPAMALRVNFIDDRIDYAIGDESGPFLTREQLDYAFVQRGELAKEEVLIALASYQALKISKRTIQ